jgi:hypothetical protein
MNVWMTARRTGESDDACEGSVWNQNASGGTVRLISSTIDVRLSES